MIRQAYARFGRAVRLQFECHRLAEELKNRERSPADTRTAAAREREAACPDAAWEAGIAAPRQSSRLRDRDPQHVPGQTVPARWGWHRAARIAKSAIARRGRLTSGTRAGISSQCAIRLVCATRRATVEDFYRDTALGRSLACGRLDDAAVVLQLFPGNTDGLPSVYNSVIDSADAGNDILVFLHDDLHLIDLFWPERVRRAVDSFDIVGLVGNRRRAPGQPSWYFVDERLTPDAAANLSGSIAHGLGFPAPVSRYGPTPRRCLLLDGLFLAARAGTLTKHAVRFDERFRFHLYDMDFCRQAERQGVSMGTWPIAVIHESGGAAGSPGWRSALADYFAKWGD